MSEAIKIAQEYFAVSNKSDMQAIALMMTPSTTYSSVRQGVFLGVDQIIDMQTTFHNSFDSLNWEIKSIDEVRPGVVLIDFVLHTRKAGQQDAEIPGDEYVIVKDGKLCHVEVRNKQ